MDISVQVVLSGNTEFYTLDDDIVAIRHIEGSEVTGADIMHNQQYIEEHYPNRRLLLVDHSNSYSLTPDAFYALMNNTYFKARATLAPDSKRKWLIEKASAPLNLAVPYQVFDDLDEAVAFLRLYN